MSKLLTLSRGEIDIRRTLPELAEQVCRRAGLGVRDIKGGEATPGGKRPEIVSVRDAFCYEAACEGYLHRQIARYLGRTREAVGWGVRREVRRGQPQPEPYGADTRWPAVEITPELLQRMRRMHSITRGPVMRREKVIEIAARICAIRDVRMKDVLRGFLNAHQRELVLARDQIVYEAICQGYLERQIAVKLKITPLQASNAWRRATQRGYPFPLERVPPELVGAPTRFFRPDARGPRAARQIAA